MQFKYLLDKYTWDEIGPILVKLYPDQEDNLADYRHVFETLRTIQPAETTMRIFIEEVWDEFTGKYYASVSGKDGTLRKDEPSEAVGDDALGDQEVSYAIELTDWAEWLGMAIDAETLSSYSEVEIIAYCLWEMTFFGYSQADIQQAIDELGSSQNR
jgi:hypothetical protein